MGKKSVKGEDELPANEEICADAMDAIEGEMVFLREIIQLLQAASCDKDERRMPELLYITDDMLKRLEKVRGYCRELFSCCNAGGPSLSQKAPGRNRRSPQALRGEKEEQK